MDTKKEQEVIQKLKQYPDKVYAKQFFSHLPEEQRTAAVSLEAVRLNGECFYLVPDSVKTDEIIQEAIKANWKNIYDIPDSKLSKEICEFAIEISPKNILHLSALKRMEKELWKKAIEKADPIQYDKKGILMNNPYPELTLYMLRHTGWDHPTEQQNHFSELFNRVPKENLTDEAVEYALRRDVRCYKYVPDEMKTYPRSLEAVSHNGMFLEYVPENLKDETLCSRAVKGIALAYDFVPEHLKTDTFNLRCTKENPMLISILPVEKRTRDICYAVLNSGESYLCNKITYPDIALCFLERIRSEDDVPLYHKVNRRILNHEIASFLIKEEPEHFKLLPSSFRTNQELGLLAVDLWPENLNYIPDKYKTEELCREAVKQDPAAILGIPPDMCTKENYQAFVKSDPAALQFIPNEYKDFTMCQSILLDICSENNNDLKGYAYVPDVNLLADAIHFHPNRKEIPEIIRQIPPNRINEKIAYEAVEKNPHSIFELPAGLITTPLVEKAVQGDATLFKKLPDQYKTPDVCLCAICSNADLATDIPDQLYKEPNILHFRASLSELTNDVFSYEQVKKMFYEGEPFTLQTDAKGKELPHLLRQFTPDKGVQVLPQETEEKKESPSQKRKTPKQKR